MQKGVFQISNWWDGSASLLVVKLYSCRGFDKQNILNPCSPPVRRSKIWGALGHVFLFKLYNITQKLALTFYYVDNFIYHIFILSFQYAIAEKFIQLLYFVKVFFSIKCKNISVTFWIKKGLQVTRNTESSSSLTTSTYLLNGYVYLKN